MAWYTILFITVASLFIVKFAISLFAGDIDMDVDFDGDSDFDSSVFTCVKCTQWNFTFLGRF